VSRTTPETTAVEAAWHTPDANVSIRAPSATSLPNLIQLACTVNITLCVGGLLPKRRAGKKARQNAMRKPLIIANRSA
jgi:hypothetical protein